MLNREIRVILKGANKYNNLFGQIKYTDQDQAGDLGSELVTSGSARVSPCHIEVSVLPGYCQR